MKIVHFSHCNLGSAEASTAHVMEFADRLNQRGHDVTVMAPGKGIYRFETNCRMRYFPYVNIKGLRQPTAVTNGFLKLLRLHRQIGFDCIYIRRLTFDPLPGIFSRITGVPLVVETNGQIEIHRYEVPFPSLWPAFWYPLVKVLERILFTSAFAVTADGDGRLAQFKERYSRTPEKFHLVRSGGIDMEKFSPVDKDQAKNQLGLKKDRDYIVWVGTIFAWSGLEVLMEAAPKVCAANPNADFLMIGDGPERSRFEKAVEQMGLSDRFVFTGYIDTARLFTWLSASKIAIAPYTRLRLAVEDFTSYKIFEYVACGLPVVCSFIDGGKSNIEHIKKYQLGQTVPPENSDALAAAIDQVLNTPDYFTEDFATHARKTLTDIDVTWESLVDQVEDLCQQAVAKSR